MSNIPSRVFSSSALLAFLLLLLTVLGPQRSHTSAQTTRPLLFSDQDSTRAIAVDSVTNKREPFSAIAPVSFAADNCTRVMLFAGNLRLTADETFNAVTADAEDESHNIHLLSVEYVGVV